MGFQAAYNTSKDIGNNMAKGFQQVQDTNAIESILSNAMSTGKQEDLNNAIGQILSQVSPQNQQNAIAVLENQYKRVQEKQNLQRQELNSSNEIKRKTEREDQLLKEKNEREDLNLSQKYKREDELLNQKNKREDEILNAKNKNQSEINKESNVPENFDKWTPAAQKNYFDSQKPKEKTKDEIKKEELEEGKQRAQEVFNEMADIVKTGNIGFGSGVKGSIPFIGANNAKDTGKFNSLTGGLEAILVDLVSRGTLSNARFKYITETLLPKPTDRDNEIIGKLEGLAVLLDLDSSALIQRNEKTEQPQHKENSEMVEMINPITGNKVPIPRNQVESALKAGGRLA